MADGPYQWQPGWVCQVCRQARGEDGHDPCIRGLPGILYACCGHGVKEGYLYFETGVRVGMNVTSIAYDDGRPRVEVPKMKKQRKRCTQHAYYKAEMPPYCSTDKFLACDACVEKWQAAQAERVRIANARPRVPRP